MTTNTRCFPEFYQLVLPAETHESDRWGRGSLEEPVYVSVFCLVQFFPPGVTLLSSVSASLSLGGSHSPLASPLRAGVGDFLQHELLRAAQSLGSAWVAKNVTLPESNSDRPRAPSNVPCY